MAPRRLEIGAAAEREAREAFLWYLERNVEAAVRFEEELTHALDAIIEGPEQVAELEPGVRRRLLARFPYAVLFTVEPARIVVLAVMHLRRRPGYWRQQR